ncbi:hypothetical protein [Petroclostridium sp. X23]|uniref:hypothetical protein n=1 Tax=Petroclostridium sp. X23 TaxID=3045146 RepID=UPI0024ACC0DC|nr:hypothetical protein [Petroclostridium sp. X23]WHH60968.1 hypothetical protein QKW49_09785 [Petroclostridium sp. X23]
MNDNTIIEEIQDEIKKEIEKYADGDQVISLSEVLDNCNAVVTRNILSAFGIGAFADQVGGAVTTIHNFKEGITATNADYKKYLQYKTPYSKDRDRPDYDKLQKLERNSRLKSGEALVSGYTGKELPKDEHGRYDGRSHLEHIVPVGEIESMSENFLFMNKEDRVKLAYIEENLTMLESSVNQSKNDIDLREWLNKINRGQTETNAVRFGIDVNMAIEAYEKARVAIKKAQRKAAYNKQAPELISTGMRAGAIMGIREVLASILIDFNQEASVSIKRLMIAYKQESMKFNDVIDEIKITLENTKDTVLEKYQGLINIFFTGMCSGFCSNILTFIINSFVTTGKNLVRILRESIYSIIRAGKIMNSNEYETQEEKINAVTNIILSSAGICLTVLLGEAIKRYIATIPYSEEISQAISGIVIGVGCIMIVYYFEAISQEVLAATAATARAEMTLVETAEKVQKLQDKSKLRQSQLKTVNKKLKNLRF